jgi:hypothetical protein
LCILTVLGLTVFGLTALGLTVLGLECGFILASCACVRMHLVVRVLCLAQVVAGRVHSLLLTATGAAWAVGSGMFGRLGLGGEGDAEAPVPIPSLRGQRIASVRAQDPPRIPLHKR